MEHLIDRDLGDFMHPDDRTQSASRLAAAQDEQVIAPLRELRIIVNGVTIPVEATGGPFLWEGKPATQFVIRDISARKNAEKALAELDRDRKIILDNMPVMIWYKDTRNNFIRVNAAVAKNTGHAVEEFEGKHAAELFPEEADAYYRDDLEVIRSGAPRYGIIEQMAAPDGKKLWVQTDKIPLKDEVGTVTGILVISIDITERKKSEEALRRSEELARARSEELATVMDSVPAAIWIAHDTDAMHITGNAHSYEWLHIPHGSESSKSAPEGIRPETFRVFKNGRELRPDEMPVQLSARGIVLRNFEFDFVYPDGTIRNVLGNASPLRDPEGNVKGSVSSFIDITDRKRAEDELVNRLEDLNAAYEEVTSTQEKLSMTVEQLTNREAQLNDALMEKEVLLSEVHHRVKNNLTAFISLLSLDGSMEETPSGKALKTDLQNRARSMALIHETLYRTGKFSTVDMDFYLTNLVGQIAKSYAERTDISIEIDAKNITLDLPRATAAGLIINELITNSFKYAFPRNFNCREERGADCVIRISLTSDNEGYELKVADNGLGLSPGIDVPTTKSLGLKLVNFLARYQLRAETGIQTDKGTEFTFRIKKTEDFA